MLGHRTLDIKDYVAILKRRGLLILVPVILFPIIAVVITFKIPPRYISQTLVLIEEQKVPDEYVKPVIASDLDSRLSSMKEQIFSRSRIQPIIERYSLYASGYTMDDRIDMARKSIAIKPIHSEIAHSGGLPGFFIAFTDSDAHTAQQVCGEITSLFLNENLRSREASAQGTTDFLKGQLGDAKRNLDEQDAKLAAFQRQYVGKLPGTENTNVNMLTSLNTQLEAATQALARMEQDKVYAESMLAQQSQSVTVPSASGELSLSSNFQDPHQAELQGLIAQEADLSSHYTADYPDVIAVRRKIADLRRQIAQAPTAKAATPGAAPAPNRNDSMAVQTLRAQIRAADIGIAAKKKEQANIQESVHIYQERIQSSPLIEEQYKELTRDYETAEKFYQDLLTKMNHSKMATDLEHRQQGEQFRVMDEANLPDSPSFPNRTVFAGGGFAAGLALGIVLAGLLEYKDTSLRTERDVWAFTKLPTLAVISFDEERRDPKPPSGNPGQPESPGQPDKPGKFVRLKGLFARKKQKELLANARG